MQIMYRKEPIPVFCGDPNLALMLLPWDDIVKLWSLKDNLFVITWLYRVTLVVADLGWVDLYFDVP